MPSLIDRREPLAGRRVLVAEDEPLLALAIADALTDLGAVVIGPYPSAGQALGAARSGDVDVAYLDFELLHGDVDRVAETLQQASVPFVLVTGRARGTLPTWTRTACVLEKPALLAMVIAALRAALPEE